MQQGKFNIKRIAFAALMLLLTWYGFTSKMNYMKSGPSAEAIVDTITRGKTLMMAIPCSDKKQDLIGFELHTKHIKHGNVTTTEYDVIVRGLDPTVDTYKTYCSDIIDDITAHIGLDEHVKINVFDSFEAYAFYNDDSLFKEDKYYLLEQHVVASYERGHTADHERYCAMTFYPYSGGGLREELECSL
jgi:hypothetical protein